MDAQPGRGSSTLRWFALVDLGLHNIKVVAKYNKIR
jgi:hypothetical protein